MNREQIIQMAREAGFDYSGTEFTWESVICTEELERFSKLVAEHEREECARICEDLDTVNFKSKSWDEGTLDCANAIRARGQA
jgi:hypothetical protein